MDLSCCYTDSSFLNWTKYFAKLPINASVLHVCRGRTKPIIYDYYYIGSSIPRKKP